MDKEIKDVDVAHYAKLARIDISPQETKALAHDFQKILAHVSDLDTIKSSYLNSEKNLSILNILSKDESHKFENNSLLKDQFPEEDNSFLRVPNIL